MPVEVIESLSTLQKRLSGAPFLETHSKRAAALENYFSRHGIIQIDVDPHPSRVKSWPKLIYPTPEKLELQIEALQERIARAQAKKQAWKETHRRASTKEQLAQVQKFADPLFWKHVTKKVIDSDYREDAKTIDLHSHLVMDEKYRPMIHAFVHNPEYRKQLTETVKSSIVYKNHKGLAKHADDRKKMQMEVSETVMLKSDEEVKESQEHADALKELLTWSRES